MGPKLAKLHTCFTNLCADSRCAKTKDEPAVILTKKSKVRVFVVALYLCTFNHTLSFMLLHEFIDSHTILIYKFIQSMNS